MGSTAERCVAGKVSNAEEAVDLYVESMEQPAFGVTSGRMIFGSSSRATLAKDGLFRICGLNSGTYHFTFSGKPQHPGMLPVRYAALDATVGDEDIEDWKVSLRESFPVTGEVIWDDPDHPVAGNLTFGLRNARLSIQADRLRKRVPLPGPFQLDLVPAEDYAIDAFVTGKNGTADHMYLKDIQVGGAKLSEPNTPADRRFPRSGAVPARYGRRQHTGPFD